MNSARLRQYAIPGLILVAVLAPLVLAGIVYLQPRWFAFGHTNHGRLVRPPVTIKAAELPRVYAKGTLPADYFHGHWTLVYVGGPNCDADCRAALYATRQARLAAGEAMRRVQRLYIVRGHAKRSRRLRRAHPHLMVVEAASPSGQAFARQFTHVRAAGGIYIVDPNSLLMMTYPPGADPSGLLKDLRRLLNANPA